MKFLVHDANGKILRTGYCPDDHLELQALEEEVSIAAEVDGSNNYIANGNVVAMPEQPSKYHVFDYTTKQWTDPRTPQDHLNANRARRNALLLACDWTQLPDVPATTQQAWISYRQALRNITAQPDQANVTWPVAP